jgi:hypothetical protein
VDDGLGDSCRPHEIQFADLPWQVHRESVVGDRQAALAALRKVCQAISAEGGLPPSPVGSEERTLLERLRAHRPVAEKPGQWAVYELPEGLPMVAVVRSMAAKSTGDARPAGPHVAAGPCRVVTWGLGIPSGKQMWTLYRFTSRGSPGDKDVRSLPVEIPPGGRPVLTLSVEEGGSLMVIRGRAQRSAWQSFYDDSLSRKGWRRQGPWRESGEARSGRFCSDAEQGEQEAEIHLNPEARGELTGVILVRRASGKQQGGDGERP